jgi:amidase
LYNPSLFNSLSVMNRRHFIKAGSIAGIAIPFLSSQSCWFENSRKKNRSDIADRFEFNEISIDALQQKVEQGEFSYREITQKYLDRIQQIDKLGPALNSVIEINPEALEIAGLMDSERRAGKIRGPLHGIPVLIKDNIDTADKMQTTAGSLALLGNIAAKDAYLVTKLRDAGAVILGKTNLSEWANFRSTRSVSGWSSRGGQTLNPYVLDRSPCGSSSGSAVAVAANLCVVAIGTETDGSIACPASMNGIVGIKPTVGLVSQAGIIPISKSQDTAGPFARTVKDAAILLGTIASVDYNDKITRESIGKSFNDYTKSLKAEGLSGKRIGIEKTMLHKHEAIDSILKIAIEQITYSGAEVVEVEFGSKTSEIGEAELEVLKYEFKDGLNGYLASSNCRLKSLEELIAFDQQNESDVMPHFKQEIFEDAQRKKGLDSKEYQLALTKCRSLRNFIDELFIHNNLAALCGPATGPSWCIDIINGDFWTGYGSYSAAAITGYPSITVPLGLVNELPVGISFIGQAFSEPRLIEIGYAYEQASKNRTRPKFLESIR